MSRGCKVVQYTDSLQCCTEGNLLKTLLRVPSKQISSITKERILQCLDYFIAQRYGDLKKALSLKNFIRFKRSKIYSYCSC